VPPEKKHKQLLTSDSDKSPQQPKAKKIKAGNKLGDPKMSTTTNNNNNQANNTSQSSSSVKSLNSSSTTKSADTNLKTKKSPSPKPLANTVKPTTRPTSGDIGDVQAKKRIPLNSNGQMKTTKNTGTESAAPIPATITTVPPVVKQKIRRKMSYDGRPMMLIKIKNALKLLFCCCCCCVKIRLDSTKIPCSFNEIKITVEVLSCESSAIKPLFKTKKLHKKNG
jgi:hypothetical protein